MGRKIRHFLVGRQGATITEWAMFAAVVSVPLLLVFVYLTNEVLAVYNTVIERLSEVLEVLWLM